MSSEGTASTRCVAGLKRSPAFTTCVTTTAVGLHINHDDLTLRHRDRAVGRDHILGAADPGHAVGGFHLILGGRRELFDDTDQPTGLQVELRLDHGVDPGVLEIQLLDAQGRVFREANQRFARIGDPCR
jgi:hypothetical protein